MQIKIVPISICLLISFAAWGQDDDPHAAIGNELFQTSDECIGCHSNLTATDGSDISIGTTWRASMMANSARDPYWHAAVRREVTDHPAAQAAIEDKCSTCHMPMAHVAASASGDLSEVFSNVESMYSDPDGHLAGDGVSCAVCHQIEPDNFGDESSFTGGFLIDTDTPAEQRAIYGPHDVDAGRQHLMRSASSFIPAQSGHLAESEMCATCHTLFTHALDDQGDEVGELAEQVPYLEWLASDYRTTQSCQDCHMPVLTEEAPISSVLGQPRPAFSQHVFRGGNAFMLSILNKYRDELGVEALPRELDSTIRRTRQFLSEETARLSIESVSRGAERVAFDIAIESLTGHKLPTAYPSRRVWLHVTVTTADGDVLFESGAVRANGSIVGNANDSDPLAFEPHYNEITRDDQVQIYEPIIVDWQDEVTTGLLYGVRYIKDNRLLPVGFNKATVANDIGVFGGALGDSDFVAGGDRIRYELPVRAAVGARIEAELLYQSIGYRWAENLSDYSSAETDRFVGYYRDTIEGSAVSLASDQVVLD